MNSTVDIFPIADAGDDFVATQGNTVTLQGDKSGGINSSLYLNTNGSYYNRYAECSRRM